VKVAVVNTSVPFLRGGAEHLAEALLKRLAVAGHEVEHVKVPLRWATPMDVAESMVAAASIRIPEADRVIALKFPAYLVPHPNKVIWLLHQFRQVYELWGTQYQDLPPDAEGQALRSAIRRADDRAFGEARAVFCNSNVTAERLSRFNGYHAAVLLAPHNDPGPFHNASYGDYILAIGRVTASKRQYLLAEAMAHASTSARLVIAGAPEARGDLDRISAIVRDRGLDDRVQVIDRFVSENEKVDLLSKARAVAYLPVDEDSYGYVTAEAMMSEKPVITSRDSGGVLELVQDDVTGFVTDPNAASLAKAIDRLTDDAGLAERLGRAAAVHLKTLDLSWETALKRLMS
jgi:glycosyltransferase involved in cell wall biosynthesis